MKKLLFTLSLLLGFITMDGQVVWRYGANMDGGWGDANIVVTPYVSFPAVFTTPYAGCHITTIRLGLAADASNVYVYIKHAPRDAQPLYRQKIGDLKAGWHDIILDTPYDVSGEDVAIGYKASFAAAGGVGYSKEKYADGDIVYYNSKNNWTATGGSVCLQALVEGEQLPQNELLMGRLGSGESYDDSSALTFTGTVRNVGGNIVERYTLSYQQDDDEAQQLTIEKSLNVNETDTFSISVPADVPGNHTLRVWVSQVNGEPDAYTPNNQSEASFTVKDPAFMRRVVCEEFTGLWCGWCPRGMVGLELMLQEHPQQFIPISIHGSDKLTIDANADYSYAQFIQSMTGAPSCKVDRRLSGDPYYDIRNLFAMETANDAAVAYSLAANWNDDGTAIECRSSYFSQADIAQADYNMAYVLTEDSITGYYQTNYYADGANGEFYGWENKASHTDDVFFNDVARGIFGGYDGMECHTGLLEAQLAQEHQYLLQLPPTIVNRSQLHVIGLLIDRHSGTIVNAFRTRPVGLEHTGIFNVNSPAVADGACYNLQGRKLSGTPCKGIYIERTPQGTRKRIR
ncbi:MAG: CARDB domain-containing protein [Prevotella sp.]